jgi:hypothetical protein
MIPGSQGGSVSPEQRRILVVRDNSANPYFTKTKLYSSVLWSFTSLHITNRDKHCRRLYIKQRINIQKTNLDPEKTTPRYINRLTLKKLKEPSN